MCTTNDFWRFVHLLEFSGKCIVGSDGIPNIKIYQGGK